MLSPLRNTWLLILTLLLYKPGQNDKEDLYDKEQRHKRGRPKLRRLKIAKKYVRYLRQ